MANELATTPPGAPPQAAEPKQRLWASEPWEAKPPRAPVDPPPCSDPAGTAAALAAPLARTTGEHSPEGLPPDLVMTPEKWGLIATPHRDLGGPVTPRSAPAMTTAEPVVLGKETATAARINQLVEKAKNGNTPDAAKG